MSSVIKSRKVIVDSDTFYLKSNGSMDDFESMHELEDEQPLKIEEEPQIDYKKIYDDKIAELENEKELILSMANQRAEEIINSASSQRDEVFEQARQEGVLSGKEEGFQSGYEQGYVEAKGIIEDALHIKESSKQQMDNYISSMENEVMELVIDSIKKVLSTVREEDSNLAIELIKLGLNKITASEQLVLKVSGEDIESIKEYKNSILAQFPRIEEITVKEDFALQKGDCIIVTESGEVDARVGTQIAALETLLRSYMGNA